jgi:hypothetical protein
VDPVSEPSPSDLSRLVFVGGPLNGQEYPLAEGDEAVFGSDPDCGVTLALGNIAPQHSRIFWTPAGAFAIADLGSSTGTFVNGERLAGERTLEDGDRICLGPPGSSESAKVLVKLAGRAASAQVDTPGPSAAPEKLAFDDEPAVALVAVPEPEFAELHMPPPVAAAPAPPVPEPVVALSEAEPELVVLEPEPPQPPPIEPAFLAGTPRAGAAPAPVKPAETRPASVAPAAPPSRPDYLTEPPSIGVSDRPRERLAVAPRVPAPTSRRPLRRPRRGLRVPRVVLIGAAAAIVGGGSFLLAGRLMRPGPVVMSLPPKADPGQVITLTGAHFDADASANIVRFGDQVATVVRAQPSELGVTVPMLPAGTVAVSVEVRATRSNALMLKISPVPSIKTVSPDVALPGQEVTLGGANLTGEKLTVTVSGVPAQVQESSSTMLKLRIPDMAVEEGRAIPIVVRVGEEVSKPAMLTFGRLPLLLEVTPRLGLAGDRVTLKGRGFAPQPAGNLVTFGGQRALVLTAQPHELTVLAPGLSVATSHTPVVVQVAGSSSQPVEFALQFPSLATYLPRFFPAPVPEHPDHDHVFVSTEISPVLVLSDRDRSASTAERAEALARALNRLVEGQRQGQTVAFECRESVPGVGLVGNPDVLVTVTAADAAAYGESWEPSVRPAPTSAKAVARHWTALLADYLALFVARQRPTRVMEVSPRGRVLLDIYAEAARRSPGAPGVPTSLVSPPSTTLAKDLRDMALLLPAGGASAPRAGTVIEGVWNGTIRDGDLTRSVQVQIALTGGRLGGTVTVRKGALSMRSPLSDVSYERGLVKLTVALGGTTRHLRGTVSGDRLSGTVHAQPDAREAVGEFDLRFSN